MKNINATNRLGLCLNAALLTLSLALLAGTPALGLARDNHGKIIHPALKSGSSDHSSNAGERADTYWWLRRWIPV